MTGTGHWFGYGCARFAGYIAPGHCRGYFKDGKHIPSYIHNDHYWGYGNVLNDPDRNMVSDDGGCYYSYYNWNHDHVNIYTSGWNVLIGDDYEQERLNELIINKITNYNKSGDNIDVYSNKVVFNEESSDYLNIESSDIQSIITDSFIKEIKTKAEDTYIFLFNDILKEHSYEISNTITTLVKESHVTYDGVNDYSNINEVLFTFNLSYKGYLFLEKNTITIGINPKTKKITTIEANLLSLKGVSSDDSKKIDQDFNLFKETDELSYSKSYIKVEDDSYHITILSFNKLTGNVNVVKIY